MKPIIVAYRYIQAKYYAEMVLNAHISQFTVVINRSDLCKLRGRFGATVHIVKTPRNIRSQDEIGVRLEALDLIAAQGKRLTVIEYSLK